MKKTIKTGLFLYVLLTFLVTSCKANSTAIFASMLTTVIATPYVMQHIITRSAYNGNIIPIKTIFSLPLFLRIKREKAKFLFPVRTNSTFGYYLDLDQALLNACEQGHVNIADLLIKKITEKQYALDPFSSINPFAVQEYEKLSGYNDGLLEKCLLTAIVNNHKKIFLLLLKHDPWISAKILKAGKQNNIPNINKLLKEQVAQNNLKKTATTLALIGMGLTLTGVTLCLPSLIINK